MEIGTHGEISAWQINADPEKWAADARYRPVDGKVRQMRRTGPTERKARATLTKALTKRLTARHAGLGGGDRFEKLADVWLKNIRRDKSGTTYDRYESRLRNHVLPALGSLTLRECTASRIADVLDELADHDMEPATVRGIRTVISGVMEVAVRRGLIDTNPVRSLGRIQGGRATKAPAFDALQLRDFLARVDGDEQSVRADLPDLVRFLFGTGVRFGEALAVRWRDLNLGDEPQRMTDSTGHIERIPAGAVWINGNIVDVKAKGLVRNEGKTFSANRVIQLPPYLVTLLMVRRPVGALLDEPVFPSRELRWRHPSNVQRSMRRMRERIGYQGFVTKVGRRTVATILDEGGLSAREIADVLGHAKPSMTQDVYMARGRANPAAADRLNRLHTA